MSQPDFSERVRQILDADYNVSVGEVSYQVAPSVLPPRPFNVELPKVIGRESLCSELLISQSNWQSILKAKVQ
jgi:hypothetical protein